MNKRAFSLLEVMIVSSMTLLMLLGIFALLTTGGRYARQTEASAFVHQQATNVIRQLGRELSSSVDKWRPFGGEPKPFIRFLSAAPAAISGAPATVEFSPTGKLIWQKYLGYYREAADNTLVRVETPLATPTDMLGNEPDPIGTPSDMLFDDLKLRPAGEKRIVGRGIELFEIVGGDEATFDIRVVARTLAGMTAAGDAARVTKVNLTTRVTMLNREL